MIQSQLQSQLSKKLGWWWYLGIPVYKVPGSLPQGSKSQGEAVCATPVPPRTSQHIFQITHSTHCILQCDFLIYSPLQQTVNCLRAEISILCLFAFLQFSIALTCFMYPVTLKLLLFQRGREEGERESQRCSTPNAEPDLGLDRTTLIPCMT